MALCEGLSLLNVTNILDLYLLTSNIEFHGVFFLNYDFPLLILDDFYNFSECYYLEVVMLWGSSEVVCIYIWGKIYEGERLQNQLSNG